MALVVAFEIMFLIVLKTKVKVYHVVTIVCVPNASCGHCLIV